MLQCPLSPPTALPTSFLRNRRQFWWWLIQYSSIWSQKSTLLWDLSMEVIVYYGGDVSVWATITIDTVLYLWYNSTPYPISAMSCQTTVVRAQLTRLSRRECPPCLSWKMSTKQEEDAFIGALNKLAHHLNINKQGGVVAEKQHHAPVSFRFRRKFGENSDEQDARAVLEDLDTPRRGPCFFLFLFFCSCFG